MQKLKHAGSLVFSEAVDAISVAVALSMENGPLWLIWLADLSHFIIAKEDATGTIPAPPVDRILFVSDEKDRFGLGRAILYMGPGVWDKGSKS